MLAYLIILNKIILLIEKVTPHKCYKVLIFDISDINIKVLGSVFDLNNSQD